jgi:hypothetical protein
MTLRGEDVAEPPNTRQISNIIMIDILPALKGEALRLFHYHE